MLATDIPFSKCAVNQWTDMLNLSKINNEDTGTRSLIRITNSIARAPKPSTWISMTKCSHYNSNN